MVSEPDRHSNLKAQSLLKFPKPNVEGARDPNAETEHHPRGCSRRLWGKVLREDHLDGVARVVEQSAQRGRRKEDWAGGVEPNEGDEWNGGREKRPDDGRTATDTRGEGPTS